MLALIGIDERGVCIRISVSARDLDCKNPSDKTISASIRSAWLRGSSSWRQFGSEIACLSQADVKFDRVQEYDNIVERVPEVELMDVPLNAQAYADADFSEPNSKFLALFSVKFPAFDGRQIIDLGCGPADITIRLAERYPQARVAGVDGADAMLDIARERIGQHPSLAGRVHVCKWYVGKEAYPLGSELFHAVVSNSLLHHMDDPLAFWNAVRVCAAPHAAVLVMDLIRPQSLGDAETIVEKYSGDEPEILKRDFLNSLRAAYRPAEIEQQLATAGMASLRVEVVSDRHFIAFGFVS